MKRAKGGLAQDPRLKEVVGQGTGIEYPNLPKARAGILSSSERRSAGRARPKNVLPGGH